MGKRVYSQEDRLDIVKEYQDGGSIADIAGIRNMPDSSVYGILHKAGVPLRSSNGPIEVTTDAEGLVQSVAFPPPPLPETDWEVEFTGTVTVRAPSIYEALNQAKKMFRIKKITLARQL